MSTRQCVCVVHGVGPNPGPLGEPRAELILACRRKGLIGGFSTSLSCMPPPTPPLPLRPASFLLPPEAEALNTTAALLKAASLSHVDSGAENKQQMCLFH